jgi:hypothetical protein
MMRIAVGFSCVLLLAGSASASLTRTITSLTGFDQGEGGPIADAWVARVVTLHVDAQGNVFYLDQPYNVIRRVDAETGIVTTVVGNGLVGPADDEGRPATEASLRLVAITGADGFTIDSRGVLYVADGATSRVRAVNTNPTGTLDVCGIPIAAGTIRTIAGTGIFGLGTEGVSGDLDRHRLAVGHRGRRRLQRLLQRAVRRAHPAHRRRDRHPHQLCRHPALGGRALRGRRRCRRRRARRDRRPVLPPRDRPRPGAKVPLLR